MNHEPKPPVASARRTWVFRLVALVGIPVLLGLALEGGLRLAGFGRPAHFLVPDDQPGYYRTNPDFLHLFLPGNFGLQALNFRVAARKPANAVRIVVLGESAAQGVPAPAFAMGAQLRAQLRARYPGKEIEVINTGIVAINSHVVYQVARDLADFSPDLFVVYLGNNEVVGPYGPGCAYLSSMPPLWVIRLSVLVRSTRTGQLVAAALTRLAPRSGPSLEWGGMSMFVNNAVNGDDPRLEAVYRNFARNLRDIVAVADGAGARTLLCTVASNLKDCPPLLSTHRAGLAGPALADWQKAFDRGRLEWLLGESAAARPLLQEAWRLDPHYADTAFMLGSIELAAGSADVARGLFLAAQHWDALRFRPDPRLNEIIREVAAAGGPRVSLVDAARDLGSDPASTGLPAGRELFFEHVHFDWAGNYRLARLLAAGAEAALFGAEKNLPPWLDSPACAAALGYTARERLGVLQRIAALLRNPPFTNQLTYPEDQARLARETAQAEALARDPAVQAEARRVVRAASAADPANPALAGLAQEIALALGDTAGALEQARRVRGLSPRDIREASAEATLLVRLGRAAEAEELLKQGAGPAEDPALAAAAWANFFSLTNRLSEGRAYLDRAIARHPGLARLRLMRGTLARQQGDLVAAEADFRAGRTADPANQEALDALVNLLNDLGRREAAAAEILSAAEQQPRNSANNLQAALLAEARGDTAQSLRCLLAAERSGPVTSAVELHLARSYFPLRRYDEMLLHLAQARRISRHEGDPAATDSITQVIASIRAEMR